MSTAQGPAVWAAYGQQTAFATPITDTSLMKFFPVKAGGLKLTRPSKPSDQLYGAEPRWAFAQNQQVDGSLPMDCYFEGLGLLLNSAMARASKAVASFVVANANKYIDFKEDGGTELTATVSTAGSPYTADSLAAAVATALNAAGGGGTYTCTYSHTTGKFSITAAGISTSLALNFATGTNTANTIAATLGYSVTDHTDASSPFTITSDTAVKDIMTHYFIPSPTGRFNVFYVRAGVNDKINFKENGGTEKTATLTPGVYTASELATEVAAQLDAAGTVASTTWTVSYSTSTHLFTIAVTTLTQLDLLFRSGSNADTSARWLLGFGAQDLQDASGAMSIAAGTAVYGSCSSAGLTGLEHRDLKTLQDRAIFLNSFQFALPENDPHGIVMTPGFIGADQTPITAVTLPTTALFDTPGTPAGNITFSVTLNGNTVAAQSFKQLTLALNFARSMGHSVGNTIPVKVRVGGKDTGTFNFAWDLEDDNTAPADLLTDWATNAAYGAMSLTQVGEVIRNSQKQTLVFSTPQLRPQGDTPPGEQGTITQTYNFMLEAKGSDGTPMVTITLTNSEFVAQ